MTTLLVVLFFFKFTIVGTFFKQMFISAQDLTQPDCRVVV